jgi:hypothetical protein
MNSEVENPPYPPLEKGGYYLPDSAFDKQGTYFWSLVKQADWSRSRVMSLILKEYSKSHWNLLDQKEKRQMIAIFKNYAKKRQSEIKAIMDQKNKIFRQRICAKWIKHGHKKEELNELMVLWGLPASLRQCSYKELCDIWRNLNQIIKRSPS